MVLHQAEVDLRKICWGNPSALGSYKLTPCHQLGGELPASSLGLSGESATTHNMVAPHLYPNRIEYSLLQVFIMTMLSFFFFSNWDSR